ncbi:uncharacterized protein LOC105700174 [Orussus abietinus]|uniref:uncharacterized protein LOC105700174 n=1 Tax=Orussus abietinus TaxID=222816 RepID=UPI000C7161D7|nr:uncharacterized protein LOC105700174 [Orussus abietinus]
MVSFMSQVLLQAALVWRQGNSAPAKRNDILAGTEFLSVFINGAMAPTPPRRRGLRRGHHTSDNVPAESQHEASIYRISRTSNVKPAITHGASREDGSKFYPVSQIGTSQKSDSRSVPTSQTEETASRVSTKPSSQPEVALTVRDQAGEANRGKLNKSVNQKVIGVSVTSTVEATPYKVRVEHYDAEGKATGTRPSTTTTTSTTTRSTLTTTVKDVASSSTLTITPLPALLVTEELSNIVSESNRSEFSVDEESPNTSWRGRVTPRPIPNRSLASSALSRWGSRREEVEDSAASSSSSEPVEESYEVSEEHSEPRETHEEPVEMDHPPQGRKAGRHYDASLYNQPSKAYSQPVKMYSKPARIYGEPAKVYSEPAKVYAEPEKVYGEPAKVYSEPAKVYGEPAKVYSEPAKIYSEPAKVYGEPEKVYSEPSRIYSEPAKIYSEPAKVYSEPAKIYSEPSKVYGDDGRPLDQREPEEQNYEVDEAVSVGSNGNVHGPQTVTESSTDAEDGHKVSYVVEGRNYRKYRVEERTPDGFIVGEYGVVSHDDGSLRGVRYTADGTINPRLIYDALMKFLAL